MTTMTVKCQHAFMNYSGTCLIRHTKEPGKCVLLYRMSEYSRFIFVNRNTLGIEIFVGWHRMSQNSCVGCLKFHGTVIAQVPRYCDSSSSTVLW